MYSVKAIQPQKLVLVPCTKCGVKSDYKDRFCQKCGETLPKPQSEGGTPAVKIQTVEPVLDGPEYIGSISVGPEKGGGFTIDPRTGEKKPTNKAPPQQKQ